MDKKKAPRVNLKGQSNYLKMSESCRHDIDFSPLSDAIADYGGFCEAGDGIVFVGCQTRLKSKRIAATGYDPAASSPLQAPVKPSYVLSLTVTDCRPLLLRRLLRVSGSNPSNHATDHACFFNSKYRNPDTVLFCGT